MTGSMTLNGQDIKSQDIVKKFYTLLFPKTSKNVVFHT